ncbi:putative WD repeat-containing protein [Mitosporidium daphniae]|uniref:Putative WD repeat-containing protein n=1 Tax=Mitosporidium daphniae TaxID=1485682 RepID=A0A098VQS8_9MICR|nr:putative WD repeat-containing protein [Mitosporidium daphniae]XP_013238513.1 putative WD repeat-containing protein [Mitosporidium daphniae]KGG51315.1 putative WD repeat-containing protein [Mitosporidium daphniae]KGG52077.1 putative WD repeat-containing protein [Mitosporidium daphniae]|eukprot:XP_013237759.1 putative WD repeat-containing protein [Mitosporidium daphniae]
MKAKLLEVYWHEKQPIYALCSDSVFRFASAGADNSIRVWTFSDSYQIVHLSSLHKHTKAVNSISFHPKGFPLVFANL